MDVGYQFKISTVVVTEIVKPVLFIIATELSHLPKKYLNRKLQPIYSMEVETATYIPQKSFC